jgi:hypothetical protein
VRVFRPLLTYPLVRPGDIARPDPVEARALAEMVDALLAGSPDAAAQADSLSHAFASWTEMARSVSALAKRTPLVAGADSAATILAKLGVVGNEALSYLARGSAPPAEWSASSKALLERADAPAGLLHVAVVPAIRKLVSAAVMGTKVETGAGTH